MLDALANIATITASATVMWVASSFKYKHDAEIRKMHLDNFKKIENFYFIFKRDYVRSNEALIELKDALREAIFWLHKDIGDFIENKILQNYQNKDLNSSDLDSRLNQEFEPLQKLYRKHILEESLKTKLSNFLKNHKVILWIILLFITLITILIP